MENILKLKGFCKSYCSMSHENYWEYVDQNGDDQTNKLARMFGLEEEQDIDYLVLQCKEDFTDCKIAANDLVWSLRQDEFFRLVEMYM